jgi:SAM-dependent methyltransferase
VQLGFSLVGRAVRVVTGISHVTITHGLALSVRFACVSTSRDAVVGLFTRAAPSYATVGPPHFTYFARRLVDFVGIHPGDRVLDVATGTGAVLLAAAERGHGIQLVGVDLTPAMLQRAAGELGRRALNAKLCVMDAERLAFQGQSFDVVVCSFALLSISDKQRALAEFRRVLAPAGRLGVLDAFGWFFEHDIRWHWQLDLLKSFGALAEHGTAEHDVGALGAILRDADYTSVQITEDAFELVFRDEDEWWQWAWSHGSRRLFESVPATRQAELKGRLFDGLAQCRQPDGLIHGTLRAVLARAQTP